MRDDVRAIEQLKYRYFRTLDLKDWAGLEATLLPDVYADYAGLFLGSAAELIAYLRENLGPRMLTTHHGHHPEIVLEDDTATGTWYLEDRVLMPDHGLVLEGAAFYDDTYVRTADGWRIGRTGYRRTWELTWPLGPEHRITLGTVYAATTEEGA